jgi:DNA-binding LacI/PurR family transcriptional regulator
MVFNGGARTMNMRQIAQRAGVSSATVSRVINGSPLVREDTATRVRQILDEVGFIPNPMATTLKYGRSRTYALVIPDITNPFYAEFLGVFEAMLTEIDYELLVTISETPDKLATNIRRMLMRQVDGAIFMASEFDTREVEALFRHRIPLVTVDRRMAEEGCSDVAIDFAAGYLAGVKHLYELGHRRIAFIGGTKGLKTSAYRLQSYRKALVHMGIPYDEAFVETGDYRIPGGEAAVLRLMSGRSKPTAILTANDMTAFGAVRGLHKLGLSVPGSVSVVGFDDVLMADVLQPALTTIRIPRKGFASECMKALTYTKEDVDRKGLRFNVSPELKVRESTGRAARIRKGKI